MNQRLLDRYRAVLASQRSRAAAGLVLAWDQLDSYNEADIPILSASTAPLLAGAKIAVVSTTAAFIAATLGLPLRPIRPTAVPVEPNLRGPFTATWHALQEHPWDDAVRVGRSAMETTAGDFLQSAARRTGDAVTADTGLTVRWTRVASAGACDWCQARHGGVYASAGDGDYGHERCHCDVVPLAA